MTTGEWRDGDTLFLRCTAWRRLAENVAESLRKGTRVVVTWRLHRRAYETDDGQKRSTVEFVIGQPWQEDLLRYAGAAPANRRGTGSACGGGA